MTGSAGTSEDALAALLQGDAKLGELSHLASVLRETPLGSLLLRSVDRLDLLAHLKNIGVSKLNERQLLANAICKHMRNRCFLAANPADHTHPILKAPLLLERYGKHAGAVGLLCKSDGSFAHVNEMPEERYGFVHYSSGLQQPKLNGPIIAEVARLAALTNRAIYVAMMDEDPFVLEPASCYLRDAPEQCAQKLADFRAAFGDDVACLTTTFAHNIPSVPGVVGMIPSFDSWAATDAHGDEWMRRLRNRPLRPDLPYAQRKDQCVWRGAKTGGDAATSLRGRVVEACRMKPWADVAFVSDMHARGLADQGEASGGLAVTNELSRDEQAGYKVILCVDGHTWASSWEWVLASGSVVVALGVWAFHATSDLEPWVHYVPCASADELEGRVKWVLEHPREAEQMALRAYALFSKLAGTPEHAKRFIARTLAALTLS